MGDEGRNVTAPASRGDTSAPATGPARLALALVLFLPFGLIATWCWWRGTQTSSVRALRCARRWSLAAIVTGAALSLVLLVLLGLLGAFPRS